MDIKELDLKTFYKMFIIYNAVIDGWKVKKVNNTDNKIQFEFKKKKKIYLKIIMKNNLLNIL